MAISDAAPPALSSCVDIASCFSYCSEVYTGQWNMLMIGWRTQFQLRFLPERFIDNGQYAFLAYLRADVQLAHGEAFNVDRGVRG